PYYVEAALSDDVLAFAPAPGDGVETAFVQLLLERLWQDTVAAGARALTVSRLDALGRERIVEQHVAAALARLSKRERTTASACFRFLVTGSSPCVPQRAADLAEWTRRPPAQVAALLERLCTSDGGGSRASARRRSPPSRSPPRRRRGRSGAGAARTGTTTRPNAPSAC